MKATRGNRFHIVIYGKRNVGKSTLFNLILGQDMSIVSDIAGTTTDSVIKSMELLPLGAISLIDSAGFDDNKELGKKRVEKTKKTLMKADAAVLVLDNRGLEEKDIEFIKEIKDRKIPTLVFINKQDEAQIEVSKLNEIKKYFSHILPLSAKADTRDEILNKFKSSLAFILKDTVSKDTTSLPKCIKKDDIVILVIPIDKEAPKGRIILPQVQVLRDLLDASCISFTVGVEELDFAIKNSIKLPKIVITDSQAFKKVSEIVPKNIMLTSFSCLFAQLKGDIKVFSDGSNQIDKLKDKDKVLILESCTHHAIEDDIGRVKIPALVKKYTEKNIIFEHFSGCDFPEDIEKYSLIIHCGACMTNRSEILSRIQIACNKKVPITNYGVAIAKCLGILDRALEPFKLL